MTSVFRILPHEESPGPMHGAVPHGRPKDIHLSATSTPVRREPFIGGGENILVKCIADGWLRDCSYNPLFVHGPTGVGKSHLIDVLASQYLERHADASVIRSTASDFLRAIETAYELDSIDELRAQQRAADLFVIDDFQELAGRVAGQAELLHTLDELIGERRQVVIASRAALADIDPLVPGLRSRLSAGLVVPMVFPGPQTRAAIIETLAADYDLTLPPEVVELLIEPRTRYPRRIDSFQQLKALLLELTLNNDRPLNANLVKRLLADASASVTYTPRQITKQTARHFKLKSADILGPSRRQSTVLARGVAIYLVRRLTGNSLEEIGRHFGDRDHSTVLHAYRKTDNARAMDPIVRNSIDEIANQLGALHLIT